jgi:hypothetical protein
MCTDLSFCPLSYECERLTSGFKVIAKKWLRTVFLSKRDEMIGTGEKVHNTSVVIDILYRILLRLLIQGN